ncbi:Zinc finger C2HC domain-containing protein 1A [Kappamyces sp. JEL0680]|nr:Zinc finger C2HC domain-containing protein 1A [Kappamyces sp. JEL0680]
MSVDRIKLNRTNSYTASISPGKVKLCHMCGDEFPKANLTSHQRACIRKNISTPNRIKFSEDEFTFASQRSQNSAPTSRRLPSHTSSRHSYSASRSFQSLIVDEERVSAAVAAESINPGIAHLPKRSFSLPSKNKLAKISPEPYLSPPHSKTPSPPSVEPGYESRPPSRAVASAPRKTSIELNAPKKKASQPIPALRVQSTPEPVPTLDKRQSRQAPGEPKQVPYPSYHENDQDEHLDVSSYLIPCDEKHSTVCVKTRSKNRKVFDVRAARVAGTEMEKYVLKKAASAAEEPPKPKKSNWRAKHEAFRQMVIAARQPAGSAPLPLTVDPNPDYITCPCCDRRFNEESGKRHIPICKEKAAKKALERVSTRGPQSSGNGGKDKLEELKRRTAYKPPSPRKPRK